MPNKLDPTAILLIHCRDRPGIIAAVTDFLSKHNSNIIDLDEHVDREHEIFFMRVEWELVNFDLSLDVFMDHFNRELATKYEMIWKLYTSDRKPRMAIFVSKLSHCLYDILSRYHSGEWNVEIPLIISNHQDLEDVARRFEVGFEVFSVTSDNKQEVEQKQLQLLNHHQIDFIVLARYMQILTPQFIKSYSNKIINIHHSFLPAFPGARPYHSAAERGVKIIGASSHYVTDELDAGPIIEQDVVRVSHKDSVKSLIRMGQDLEKIVLSRAIWQHLQHKILVFKNRTVIFD